MHTHYKCIETCVFCRAVFSRCFSLFWDLFSIFRNFARIHQNQMRETRITLNVSDAKGDGKKKQKANCWSANRIVKAYHRSNRKAVASREKCIERGKAPKLWAKYWTELFIALPFLWNQANVRSFRLPCCQYLLITKRSTAIARKYAHNSINFKYGITVHTN